MTALEDPRWLALSKERRSQLLEVHRNTNVEYDWWDGVYEMFDDQMAEIGVRVDTQSRHKRLGRSLAIYFSGFWSQGDGACFDGRVSDWRKFLLAAEFPQLAEAYLKFRFDLGLSWAHSGRYYHPYCVQFSSDLAVTNPHDEDADPFQHAIWGQLFEAGAIFENVKKDLIEFVRGRMNELYKQLEKEYDYLTSDEVVVEHILEYHEEELAEEDEDENGNGNGNGNEFSPEH